MCWQKKSFAHLSCLCLLFNFHSFCVQRIDASTVSDEPFAQHQRLTLCNAQREVGNQQEYKKRGKKHLLGMVHANFQQRSNTTPLWAPMDAASAPPTSGPAAGASAAACAIPPAPPLPPAGHRAASDTRAERGREGAAVKVKYNPYRGKKKATLMAKFWDDPSGSKKPPEEE